jgi:Ca2+-binding EF-hand superfamily protein
LDRERLRRVFDAIDRNGDLFLDKEEMVSSVSNTGESRTDHNTRLVLSSAFKDMDTNHDGKVSIDEWNTYFDRKAEQVIRSQCV